MADRPTKIIRLNYHSLDPELAAHITMLGNPSELRFGLSDKIFMSLTQQGLSFSPGFGNKVNMQMMPGGMIYGGLIKQADFPRSLIPSTMATPLPMIGINLPFKSFMNNIRQLAQYSAMMMARGI